MVPQERTLRIIEIVFVAFGLSLFVVLHLIGAHHPASEMKLVHKVIAGLGIVDVVLGIVFQRHFTKSPKAHGTTAATARRWFAAHIIRLAFTMSTCLLGLAVHTMGAPKWLGHTLVGVGVLFMMIMKTGRAPAEMVSGVREPVASSQ